MRNKKQRITGWRYNNPAEVEFAFRRGFLQGVQLGWEGGREDIIAKHDRVMELRHMLWWGDRWSDVRAARLRGISHGLRYLNECYQRGGDVASWLSKIRAWTRVELPEIWATTKLSQALPPTLFGNKKPPTALLATCRKVDLSALLRKIATVAEMPEEYVLRQGAWLKLRSWQLYVCVDRQFQYRGKRNWSPGIFIRGCDPQGRFGSFEFHTFDEITTDLVDVPRVEAFLQIFSLAHRKAKAKIAARRCQGKTANAKKMENSDQEIIMKTTSAPIKAIRDKCIACAGG